MKPLDFDERHWQYSNFQTSTSNKGIEVEREGLLAMCSKYFIPVINQLLEEVAKGLEICAVVIIIPQQSVGACSKAFQTTSELVLFY